MVSVIFVTKVDLAFHRLFISAKYSDVEHRPLATKFWVHSLLVITQLLQGFSTGSTLYSDVDRLRTCTILWTLYQNQICDREK